MFYYLHCLCVSAASLNRKAWARSKSKQAQAGSVVKANEISSATQLLVSLQSADMKTKSVTQPRAHWSQKILFIASLSSLCASAASRTVTLKPSLLWVSILLAAGFSCWLNWSQNNFSVHLPSRCAKFVFFLISKQNLYPFLTGFRVVSSIEIVFFW